MGIPRYFGSVVRNINGVVNKGHPTSCDFLCVDFNAMIHPVVRQITRESTPSMDVIFSAVFDDLERLVGLCSPEKKVFIAHDGVCPYAKIIQQRRRRFLGHLERKFKSEPEPPFDSVHISPGTEFTTRLTKYIQDRCCEKGWMYSGADEEGEGEQKIFKFLKLFAGPLDKVTIHGLDADMILLSLCSRIKNIRIMREDIQSEYINVDSLFKEIACMITKDESQYQNAIDSYCFMMSVCGNDFLPKMPGMQVDEKTVERIISSIANNIFIDNLSVSTHLLWNVLNNLALQEDTYVCEMNDKYIKTHARMGDKLPVSHLAFKMGQKTWRLDYHAWFCKGCDPDTVVKISNDYIRGMMFVWDYYTFHGNCTDWTWFYPWNHAPSMLELSNYILEYTHSVREYKKAVSVDVQLLSIVPRTSRGVLPNRLSKVYERISYLHPVGTNVCSYGVYKFHEIVPFLPPISPSTILAEIEKNTTV